MKTKIYLLILSLLIGFTGYSQYARNQKIQAAEYFINSDPGVGKGIAITITPGLTDITINLTNLVVPVGSKVYVRVQSTNGFWSAPRCLKRLDYYTITGATIQYGEYFINTDPGQGNGIPLTFTSGIANIQTLLLKQGEVVYIRIKDSYNRWSPAKRITYRFYNMRKAEYKIKLASNGNYTTPALMTLTPSPVKTCEFNSSKNNITWNTTDTIYVRYQTLEGFYSLWKLGIIAEAGQNQTICKGQDVILKASGGGSYKWSNNMTGKTIIVTPDSTTTYKVTVSDGMGASSTDSIIVFVIPKPPTPSITQNGKILNSSSSTSNQWYDLTGAITGATGQSFTPTKNGQYWVIVTINGCSSDISNKLYVNLTGIDENISENEIEIFPNPNSGIFYLKITSLKNELFDLTIYNTLGKVVFQKSDQKSGDNSGMMLNLSGLSNGIYYLKIRLGSLNVERKVLLER